MAGTYNFTIDQGASFSKVLTWKDSSGTAINLSGYTAKMEIRDKIGGTILKTLTSSSGIALGGSAGTITITISAADTASLDFETAVFDLFLINGQQKTRLIKGIVTVSKSITQ